MNNDIVAKTPIGGTMMNAVVQREYGAADTLGLEKIAIPRVGPKEVLIEVVAAGMDRGVWHLMKGLPYLIRLMGYGVKQPKSPVLGMDVSGRVVDIGDQVDRFSVGDEVFGIGKGTYAEFAVADETKLARKPSNIDFGMAAASAISGITALQAVEDVARIQAGQNVLVIGASGGVGSFAVQIARARGATVTGVSSGAKMELVRSFGAGIALDYRKTDYVDGTVRYDAILDVGGRNPIKKLRKALRPEGTLVIVGGEGGDRLTGGVGRNLKAMMISPLVSQRLTGMISTEHFEFIERLSKLLETGQVKPYVVQRFGIDQVPEAINGLETGANSGKSIIVIRDEER